MRSSCRFLTVYPSRIPSSIFHAEAIAHGSVYISRLSQIQWARGRRETKAELRAAAFLSSLVRMCALKAPFPTSASRKKSSRNITYDEFKVALTELARKKYKEKSAEEAEAEVFKLIEGKSPIIAGVTVSSHTLSPLTNTLGIVLEVNSNLLFVKPTTESRGLSDGEPTDGHLQVHGFAQGALRPVWPREGEGGPRRHRRQVGIRLGIQT